MLQFPFKKIFIVLFIVLSGGLVADQDNEDKKYRFSFSIRGDMKGRILLIKSFRQFYEAGASAVFTLREDEDGNSTFCFHDIDEPGYMMRTHGMSGHSLSILTADYNIQRAENFRDRKIDSFKINVPHFYKTAKKINRRYPFYITSRNPKMLQFTRDKDGRIGKIYVNVAMEHPTYMKEFTTAFNIYRILAVMLRVYNHSYLPAGVTIDTLADTPDRTWLSEEIKFSRVFMGVMNLASRSMGSFVKFRQRKPVRLNYRIIELTEDKIHIEGNGDVNIKVWGKIRLKKAVRKIVLNRVDGTLFEDTIDIELRDKKGKGWIYGSSLKLLEDKPEEEFEQ